jgi:hypothetical protein
MSSQGLGEFGFEKPAAVGDIYRMTMVDDASDS